MVTQAAKIYIALFLTFLLIAVNTPVNFIYWMCASLGAMLILGFLLTLFVQGDISAQRQHAETTLQGDPVDITVVFQNKSRFRKYFLLFEEQCIALRKKTKGVRVSFLVAHIKSRETSRLNYTVSFPERGIYRLGPCVTSAGWPLGLFVREKEAAPPTSFFVLPRPVPLKEFYFSSAGDGFYGKAESSLKPGNGIDIYGTREYRPGDSLSHIHWKSTAKMQTLIIKEFEGTGCSVPVLFLDVQKGTDIPEGKEKSTLETAVTVCASLGHFFFLSGQPFYFVSRGVIRSVRGVNMHSGDYEYFLRELALIEADGTLDFSDAVVEELSLFHEGISPILISSSGQFWSHSASLLGILRQMNTFPCFMIIDASSFLETPDKTSIPEVFYNCFADLKQKGYPAYYFSRNSTIAHSFSEGARAR